MKTFHLRTFNVIALAGILIVLLAFSVNADPIAGYKVDAGLSSGTGEYSWVYSPDWFVSPISNSGTWSNGSGSVMARATYGDIGVFATVSGDGGEDGGGGNAFGQGQWKDQWTINGEGLAGTLGTLRLEFHVSGSTTADTDNPHSEANYSLSVSGGMGGPGYLAYQQKNPGTYYANFDFIFDNPFGIVVFFQAVANAYGYFPVTATADFGTSSILTGLQVFDSNQNPVSNFTLETYSGYDYLGQTPVPEPATLILLGPGLFALFGYGRRKQCRK